MYCSLKKKKKKKNGRLKSGERSGAIFFLLFSISSGTILYINTFSQAKGTNSTLFVTYPWPTATLNIETPAEPPIEYHKWRNLCWCYF